MIKTSRHMNRKEAMRLEIEIKKKPKEKKIAALGYIEKDALNKFEILCSRLFPLKILSRL